MQRLPCTMSLLDRRFLQDVWGNTPLDDVAFGQLVVILRSSEPTSFGDNCVELKKALSYKQDPLRCLHIRNLPKGVVHVVYTDSDGNELRVLPTSQRSVAISSAAVTAYFSKAVRTLQLDGIVSPDAVEADLRNAGFFVGNNVAAIKGAVVSKYLKKDGTTALVAPMLRQLAALRVHNAGAKDPSGVSIYTVPPSVTPTSGASIAQIVRLWAQPGSSISTDINAAVAVQDAPPPSVPSAFVVRREDVNSIIAAMAWVARCELRLHDKNAPVQHPGDGSIYLIYVCSHDSCGACVKVEVPLSSAAPDAILLVVSPHSFACQTMSNDALFAAASHALSHPPAVEAVAIDMFCTGQHTQGDVAAAALEKLTSCAAAFDSCMHSFATLGIRPPDGFGVGMDSSFIRPPGGAVTAASAASSFLLQRPPPEFCSTPCLCRTELSGLTNWIMCASGDLCPFAHKGWFHVECTGLQALPAFGVEYYCYGCMVASQAGPPLIGASSGASCVLEPQQRRPPKEYTALSFVNRLLSFVFVPPAPPTPPAPPATTGTLDSISAAAGGGHNGSTGAASASTAVECILPIKERLNALAATSMVGLHLDPLKTQPFDIKTATGAADINRMVQLTGQAATHSYTPSAAQKIAANRIAADLGLGDGGVFHANLAWANRSFFTASNASPEAVTSALGYMSQDSLSRLSDVASVHRSETPPFSVDNQVKWSKAVNSLFESFHPVLSEEARKGTAADRPVGIVYMIKLQQPAEAWTQEIDRVWGTPSTLPSWRSQTHPKGIGSVPWAYAVLLKTVEPVVRSMVGSDMFSAFYLGCSNAMDSFWRVFQHCTPAGNSGLLQLLRRARNSTAYVAYKRLRVDRRIVASLPFAPSGSPMAPMSYTLEAVVGLATGMLCSMRPSFNCSPQGGNGLLLEKMIIRGAPPVVSIAGSVLTDAIFAAGSVTSFSLLPVNLRAAGGDENVFAHLRAIAVFLCKQLLVPATETVNALTAWTTLLGTAAVASAAAAATARLRGPAAARVHADGSGGAASSSCTDSTAAVPAGEPVRVTLSEPSLALERLPAHNQDAFLDASGLTLSRVLELLQYAATFPTDRAAAAGLAGVATIYSYFNREYTSKHAKILLDLLRRRARDGLCIDQHLIAKLTGELHEAGWATNDISYSPFGVITALRSVIVSPLMLDLGRSHPLCFDTLVIDATFGVSVFTIDFFVFQYIHPVTHQALPLGLMLRQQHSSGFDSSEETTSKTDDIAWGMRMVLKLHNADEGQTRLHFQDKCAATVAAAKENCIKRFQAFDAASRPAALPFLSAAESAAEPPLEPHLILPSAALAAPTAEIPAAIGSLTELYEHLRPFAMSATSESGASLKRYLLLSPAGRLSFDSSHLSQNIGGDLGAARTIFASNIVDLHPALVPPLARKILLDATSACNAMQVVYRDSKTWSHCESALSELESLRQCIGVSGFLDNFFLTHVEKYVRLCIFHGTFL